MPVFECSRCNNLTYSASRFALLVCDVCGSNRQRILEHAFSFTEARDEPRDLASGDHCCLSYADLDEAVTASTRFVRHGLAAGARVLSHIPAGVERGVRDELRSDEDELVEWGSADDIYAPGFDVEEIVARFVAVAEAEPRTVYVLGGPDRPFEEFVTADGYERYERCATEATTATGMVVLCLVDRTLHASDYHLSGLHTHPLTVDDDGAVKRNERFVYA
jgi:MEDS: MEthanogen/methylotroph, DcmR Sensory domain